MDFERGKCASRECNAQGISLCFKHFTRKELDENSFVAARNMDETKVIESVSVIMGWFGWMVLLNRSIQTTKYEWKYHYSTSYSN